MVQVRGWLEEGEWEVLGTNLLHIFMNDLGSEGRGMLQKKDDGNKDGRHLLCRVGFRKPGSQSSLTLCWRLRASGAKRLCSLHAWVQLKWQPGLLPAAGGFISETSTKEIKKPEVRGLI